MGEQPMGVAGVEQERRWRFVRGCGGACAVVVLMMSGFGVSDAVGLMGWARIDWSSLDVGVALAYVVMEVMLVWMVLAVVANALVCYSAHQRLRRVRGYKIAGGIALVLVGLYAVSWLMAAVYLAMQGAVVLHWTGHGQMTRHFTIWDFSPLWFIFLAMPTLAWLGAAVGAPLVAKGRCIACGYDLRGTPEAEACPECGEPVERFSR